MSQSYTASDIEVLSGLEPVRRRPGMYTHTSRPNHLAHEVIDNSVDEAIAGYCKQIDVVLVNGDPNPNRPDLPQYGGGETICKPLIAAVANAIYDATGVRLRRMPFRSAPSGSGMRFLPHAKIEGYRRRTWSIHGPQHSERPAAITVSSRQRPGRVYRKRRRQIPGSCVCRTG